ncbi:MAG: hypothetical protein LOD94_13130 [Gammaproteobacteria bacterium]
MASHSATLRNKLTVLSIAAVLLLVHAIVLAPQAAAETDGKAEPFTWSAELVSFDASSSKITLKSYLDTRVDRAALEALSEGDLVTIGWTGLNWGAGIAAVAKGAGAKLDTSLNMPAEFVRTEMDGQYLVYRLPLPREAAERIRTLEPGAWVTATSPRDAESLDAVITKIRPYNDVE